MIKKIISILLMVSFFIAQEPCEGTCYSEEEEINIENHINDIETQLKFSNEQIFTLKSLMVDFEKNDSLNVSLINDYKKQLEYKDEMIKLIKPKWYDNKYLWLFGGIIMTSGAVHLAGELK